MVKFTGINSIGNTIVSDNGTTVNVAGDLEATGSATFGEDANINGLTVGRGSTNISTNTAVGASALFNNTTGDFNTASGVSALENNTTAAGNTAIGGRALRFNTTGSQNAANGALALQNNTTGSFNTASGSSALFSNTTGVRNTANGVFALYFNTTGSDNVANGYSAGRFITGGATENTIANNSIFIGAETKAEADNQTNQIVIGFDTTGNGSNTVTIGNDSITDTYLKGDVSVTGDVFADSHVTNGGTSSDFVKGDGSLDSTTYQDASEKNQANGYAPLDSGAKIPIANLPDSVVGQVEYQGTWNASTDTPTLPAASGVKGHYYVVSVGGTYETIVYAIGDWIISNGTAWEKVDNTDAVTTVFGRLGAILANESDYSSFYPLLGTTISAGSGLIGGGDLSANRTISHDDTSSQGSVNNSGGTVIQDVTLDGFGHVTGLESIDLDGRYVQTLTGTTQTLAKFTASGNTVEDSNIVLASGANFVDTTIGSTSGAVNQSNNLYLLATTRPQIYLTASSYTANLFNENGDIELEAQFTSPSLFYNSIFRYNGSSATNKSLVFQTDSLDRLTINQSGSAEFSSDLTVTGSVTATTGEFISGGQDGSLGSVVRIGTTNTNAASRNWAIVSTWDNFGDLAFRVSNALGGNALLAGSNVLELTSSGIAVTGSLTATGNVGIGTSNTTTKLQIHNTSAGVATVAAFLVNESTNLNTETRLAFAANTNSDIATERYSYISTINTSGSNGQAMTFATNATGASATERMRIDSSGNVTINNNLSVTGSLSKGSGSFKIDHPLPEKKDTHHLVHSFVEAPQADNIYRGKIDLSQGQATVNLDEAGRMTEGTFVLLNGNIQCFTSNESGWTAIRGKVEGNILTIEAQDAECTDTISWLVIGERIDQHMIDTEWTDENGRVITEPIKKVESTPEEEEEGNNNRQWTIDYHSSQGGYLQQYQR